jgi:predicted transcriptional regulator
MREELQVLGLTRNEAEVYEALVKSGLTKAGHLIARLDIHRNIVYEALDSLIRKGFVTRISKRGVWWFQITEPDSILTMLRRREEIAGDVIKEIKHLKQQVEQQITVYEGVDSLRAYWLSTLERFPEGTVDYCLGLPLGNRWEKLMGEAALKKYVELRARKKFVWKTVLFDLEKSQVKHFKNVPGLTEYRLWPKKIKPIGNFNVMHDTVILQTMTDTPRIIEIRDGDMVTVFKNYFDAVWEDATPVELA